MKKTFDYNYDMYEARAKFEIDFEKFTTQMAKETLDFFTWDYDKENDPIEEVMKKYAMAAIISATENNYNTNGVIEDFNNKEGFCKIDGSAGILLVFVSGYEFDEEKLECKII